MKRPCTASDTLSHQWQCHPEADAMVTPISCVPRNPLHLRFLGATPLTIKSVVRIKQMRFIASAHQCLHCPHLGSHVFRVTDRSCCGHLMPTCLLSSGKGSAMCSFQCLHGPRLQAGSCAQRSDLLVCPSCLFQAPAASEALTSPGCDVHVPLTACAAILHCGVLTCSSWRIALL